MHNGQADKAAQALLSLISYSEDIDNPGCTGIAMSLRARYSLLRGDLESAVRWVRTVDLASHGGLMMWWIEVPRITACRVLIAEGTSLGLERAVSMLEDFIKENAAVKNLFQQVVMLPLLAVALYKQGQADEAMEAMKSALELAEASSVIAPFMEFRPEMIDILRMVSEKDSKNEFAGRLIETITRKEPASGPEKGKADAAPSRIASGDFLMEALTNRELAALKYLAKGLYYKEIADEMAVSKDTVKTHLRHVYQKLQVENRREAVAMARKLGILDPTP